MCYQSQIRHGESALLPVCPNNLSSQMISLFFQYSQKHGNASDIWVNSCWLSATSCLLINTAALLLADFLAASPELKAARSYSLNAASE